MLPGKLKYSLFMPYLFFVYIVYIVYFMYTGADPC